MADDWRSWLAGPLKTYKMRALQENELWWTCLDIDRLLRDFVADRKRSKGPRLRGIGTNEDADAIAVYEDGSRVNLEDPALAPTPAEEGRREHVYFTTFSLWPQQPDMDGYPAAGMGCYHAPAEESDRG